MKFVLMYRVSTLVRAQRVRRKKVRLDFMLGSLEKQRTRILAARPSHL